MAKLLVVLALVLIGMMCPIIVEVYRHRSWVRHRDDSAGAPGTGGLVLVGGAGGALFVTAALLVILFW